MAYYDLNSDKIFAYNEKLHGVKTIMIVGLVQTYTYIYTVVSFMHRSAKHVRDRTGGR